MTTSEKHVKDFKKKHKNIFIKSKRIFAKEKINFSIKKFVQNWAKKNSNKISEMSIENLKIL